MLIPRAPDAVHKAWMYRLLIAVADDVDLMKVLRFKGGTCATMAGYIDRFSVGLDFDYIGDENAIDDIREKLRKVSRSLSLEIKDFSKRGLQFFLKYPADTGRNTLKIDANFPAPKNNLYTPLYLADIERTLPCQTIETMFANKMVSIIDRYEKYKSVAGRDIYDIHQFFLKGFRYHAPIIEERRGVTLPVFLGQLIEFIKKYFTETVISQDLNVLLIGDQFKRIRKTLIPEVLTLLKDELRRVTAI